MRKDKHYGNKRQVKNGQSATNSSTIHPKCHPASPDNARKPGQGHLNPPQGGNRNLKAFLRWGNKYVRKIKVSEF